MGDEPPEIKGLFGTKPVALPSVDRSKLDLVFSLNAAFKTGSLISSGGLGVVAPEELDLLLLRPVKSGERWIGF